ncbi:MAG: FGGY-family carbohydrate kinase [Defluviitaleaceae bacterium]|nr:FGGY-family carbohydrate kinase [Defluviitaleaceae bacterium]MCL2835609.1 FGGY-family carbohydrate kinase [Defluviitaleaceae bacterium]
MKHFLGIELGSTRIKAMLIGENYIPAASGSFDWENRYENGHWTYNLDDVWTGLQTSFKRLVDEYAANYGKPPEDIGGIGISAMMHGYLPFDKDGRQLAGFRTWRNTNTGGAAAVLTKIFGFNIPLRWSAAHLYQAVLNGEEHVKDIHFLTTLAGYVHYSLTGEKAAGIGEASGMFPVDSATGTYNMRMLNEFDALIADKDLPWKVADILPKSLGAGENAGTLTAEGAKLLDPSGLLKPGIPFCPPEGDAGTGMVATNSVTVNTGNVSAGTSIFAMFVLEKELSRLYEEIDMVMTPAGKPVAMVHGINCTGDLDAWVKVFGEAASLLGVDTDKSALYDTLYAAALDGDADCGGLFACNYTAGEHLTGFDEGRPVFARTPDSRFTLANFMRAHLFAAMATLKIGMDIIAGEKIKLELLQGHGGLFKAKNAGQKLMAGALNVPVAVMEAAGEGGAWGIALLAAYTAEKSGETLEAFLQNKVFSKQEITRVDPDEDITRGFAVFMERYKAGLNIVRAAVEHI